MIIATSQEGRIATLRSLSNRQRNPIMTTEIQINDLERFGNCLSILAEMNMDSRLRSKMDVADIVQQASV